MLQKHTFEISNLMLHFATLKTPSIWMALYGPSSLLGFFHQKQMVTLMKSLPVLAKIFILRKQRLRYIHIANDKQITSKRKKLISNIYTRVLNSLQMEIKTSLVIAESEIKKVISLGKV